MNDNGYIVPYIPNTEAQRQEMLKAIGVASAEELFQDIPPSRRNPSLDLPSPLSELELTCEIEEMARQNCTPGQYACFLGGGVYRHFVPAVVRRIIGRGEFMTPYTPYQPEVSQGTLQVAYEFQSLVCQLTGMEVANTGMYDGATAFAEAALMACRVTGRDRIVVLDTVASEYRDVLRTYTEPQGLVVEQVQVVAPSIDKGTACLMAQSPNLFGYVEDQAALQRQASAGGALLVVSVDSISLGLFRPPGDYNADIVVAEGQPLGVPLSFGGPYMGIFACKEKYLRQMPGRIVGRTLDTQGRTGYVLTLQTREQHIRRERATSNICTSQSLMGLAATVYLAVLGKRGLRQVAELCYHKAHYAAGLIRQIPGFSLPMGARFFKEFLVHCPIAPAEINERLIDRGIIGGLDVSGQVPNGMVLCVTEVNSRLEIDSLVEALKEIGSAV